jgi:formylglycine-generating enzyme required for sulfatase activity
MVPISGGIFQMGSTEDPSEQPPHRVIVKSFLMGKYPITVGQFKECTRAQACNLSPAGDELAPVSNVSWVDANQYVTWLAQATKLPYRLPTEAEWEFAARGGTDTKFWWGSVMKPGLADCKGCVGAGEKPERPTRIGTMPPNPFGLFDINGGLSEWVEDCWVRNYQGAPVDGSARMVPQCQDHVLRGAAWNNDVSYARVTSRDFYAGHVRYPTHGFRVARSSE